MRTVPIDIQLGPEGYGDFPGGDGFRNLRVGYENAWIPVIARPMISVWISSVPS
jgi:hypothetical protein